MENLRKELKQQQKTSLKAIKIALIGCIITLLFATLSLLILLKQITATANLSKNQKNLEQNIMQLERNQKMPTH